MDGRFAEPVPHNDELKCASETQISFSLQGAFLLGLRQLRPSKPKLRWVEGADRTSGHIRAQPTPSAEDRFLPFPPIHWAHLDRQQRVDSGGSDADARHPEGDKIMRLHAQTATIENGFVWLPEAAP